MEIIGHTLGFPRIGLHRELKYALESYWAGKIQQHELLKTGRILRARHWKQQKEAGIDLIPVGDFAWYDHVLTTSLMINNIPSRYQSFQKNNNLLDVLFGISRGCSFEEKTIAPSEMKKWFNTNYHYIVPELTQTQKFQLNWNQLFDEIDEAISLKYQIKPILLGPLSYLWLGSTKKKFDKLSLLPSLLSTYQEILNILSKKNIHWVQIDEPILVLELSSKWITAFLNTYQQLYNKKIKLLLTTYFDDIYHQLDIIKTLKIDGLHVDLTSSVDNIPLLHEKLPKDWVLSAGVINGRNIWKTNLYNWFKKLTPILKKRTIWIGSSCSLLHSPIDLKLECELLNKQKKQCFSFALQKCSEIKILCTMLREKIKKNSTCENILNKYNINHTLEESYNNIRNQNIKIQLKNINHIPHNRNTPYTIRSKLQNNRFHLPLYPTTTIGSFPQTKEIRDLRLSFRNKKIHKKDYTHGIKNYIQNIIKEQEKLNLDVLVHGEPERNDMVEYFGENLNGFIFTQHGWVQSYGSRCVKPPIIFGDISRPKPITVKWINYAQSLTNKPVKGILTGPITLMTWSFIREDIQRKNIALQLSLSIRDEVMDLEKSGVGIIQIDEPALREGLPLKKSQHQQYLEWAVHAFKITVSSVQDDTQIHTHMCYSEFNDIIHAIIKLDTDVISIESSRSDKNSLIKTIKKLIQNNINAIGPGIYDIHSPNNPHKIDIINKLHQLLQYIPKTHLWVNPDCGLKTRSWSETKHALQNMVCAAKTLRKY